MWVYVKDLKEHIGQEVELKGWVWRSRSSGKIAFINLRDGTGIVQV
ncbi:MAG: asparagine--tRNA ligase, partial [Thermosipho sp. (in: Bacteria)]|nr:asparagine--tRNA ligase [Thermosipho sp. (in: thermotogales)]